MQWLHIYSTHIPPLMALALKISDSWSTESDCHDTPHVPRHYHYFNNNPKHIIDLVLVSKHSSNQKHYRAKMELKKRFHREMRNVGFQVELDPSDNENYLFTLIHVPRRLMCDQAEAMRFKVPIKRENVPTSKSNPRKDYVRKRNKCPRTCAHINPLKLDSKFLPFIESPRQYLVEYNKQRAKYYIPDSQESFFRPTQRIKAAWDQLFRIRIQKSTTSSGIGNMNIRRIESEIMRSMSHSRHNKEIGIGLDKLIEMGVFDCVYPLHDGPPEPPHNLINPMRWNTRAILGVTWCRMSMFLKQQPLWTVSEYFGKKIALYFTWLEFYTRQLMYLSAIGIIVTIYGYAKFDDDTPSKQICDIDQYGNLTMCPECEPPYCKTYRMINNCQKAKHTHAFENDLVPIWGLALSCWAIVFLELWKRKKAKITDEWGIMKVSDEEKVIRANYEYHSTKRKKNKVTRMDEPYIDRSEKLYRRIVSWFVVIFCIMAMISFEFVLSIIRTELVHEFHRRNFHEDMPDIVFADIRVLAGVVTSVINLTVSLVFEKFYTKLTVRLNEFDLYRTEEAFENNYIYKIIIFQYFNYFTPIYYIAFVKNSVISNPGDIKGFVEEGCALSNCEIEVVTQYVVIMIGRQIYTSLAQIVKPWCIRKIKSIDTTNIQRCTSSRKLTKADRNKHKKQYVVDRRLAVPDKMPLVSEYLELVVQYGFVILSVTFPLAAFFALINNAFEIRIDAGKFVLQTRRPIPETVDSIGAWYSIMKWTAKLGVLANAFYIAFTTDIVPRWYFYMQNGRSLDGYLNSTLARFATADYGSKFNESDVKFCYYIGYRLPPEHERKYEVDAYWWQTFAARITFVIIFERCVYLMQDLFNLCVSDVPRDVRYKLRRTNYLARRALYDYRLERVQRKSKSKTQLLGTGTAPSDKENDYSPNASTRSTQTEFHEYFPDAVIIQPGDSPTTLKQPAVDDEDIEIVPLPSELISTKTCSTQGPSTSRSFDRSNVNDLPVDKDDDAENDAMDRIVDMFNDDKQFMI